MASVIQYNPSDPIVVNRVTLYLPSANTPDYSGQPNTLINPSLSGVSGVQMKYWKVTGGTTVVEMTTAEKADIDNVYEEEQEETSKLIEIDTARLKFYKMLKRLDRKASAWSMTNTDLKGFVNDLFKYDSSGTYEALFHRYLVGVDNPLKNFIDAYDLINPKFTQAIQNELIGIL